MKILTVVGARPQFIKAAVVSRVLRQEKDIQEVLVHTGQHYDPAMSDVFFRELDIPPPDYNLEIGSLTHGAQTGRMLEALATVMSNEKPDVTLVYGDTNSTLAGMLAAVKLHIPVAHVKAGLRSFNRRMPEEINRILTDHGAELLFAPTEAAVQNLRREGIPESKIHLTGDVMYDTVLYCAHQAQEQSTILNTLGLRPQGYIVATIHRAENTDDPIRLRVIFEALGEVSRRLPIITPLHPRTRSALTVLSPPIHLAEGLVILEPVGYLDMAELQRNASVVVTDSGGMQKEAYFHRVPCVTLRGETEWVELVDTGWNRLVPPLSLDIITQEIRGAMGRKGEDTELYGTGVAAEKIVELLWTRTER